MKFGREATRRILSLQNKRRMETETS